MVTSEGSMAMVSGINEVRDREAGDREGGGVIRKEFSHFSLSELLTHVWWENFEFWNELEKKIMFSKHFIRKPRAALLGVPALVTLLALLSWLLSAPLPTAYAQDNATQQLPAASAPARELHTAMVTMPGKSPPRK